MRGIGLVGTAATLVLLAATTPARAVPTFFDVLTSAEVITGPPYPTTRHRTDVAHEASGVLERDGQLALGVREAIGGSGAPLGVALRPVEIDARTEGFSDRACFEGRYCAVPGVTDPTEGFIELVVELTGSGERPGRLEAINSEIPIGDLRRFVDVVFDSSRAVITCRVRFGRGVEHELVFLGELPEGLNLAGVSVATRERSVGDDRRATPREENDFFRANPDGLLRVRFHLTGDTAFVDQSLLLLLTFTGRFLGGASPVETATWGEIKFLYGD